MLLALNLNLACINKLTLLPGTVCPDADDKLPLKQCTAGCTMIVPADGMVFMILLTVPAGDKIPYNFVT